MGRPGRHGRAGLRELNRRHALVFLPSHRSYADPLLLADVLAEHDFPQPRARRRQPPHLADQRAGQARRDHLHPAQLRRREIYKLALREYLGYLLAKRFNLEWYLEGGRSRTGKLRPPRYGLLAYVAEAVARGRADDACLVPVAITYDQLREVSAMAAEQGGGAKKAEGLGWLASYAKGQLAKIGTVHVRFAEPLSLREALEPGGHDDNPDTRRLALQKVAFEVAVRINRVTPVTATALVTLALLGVRDRALTLARCAGSSSRCAATWPSGGCRIRVMCCAPTPGCAASSARWPSRMWSRSTPADRSRFMPSSGASTSSRRSTGTARFIISSIGR